MSIDVPQVLRDERLSTCPEFSREDTVSPAFLIQSADLKIVETVDGVKMVASNAISDLASLVSVNIQLHFKSKRLPGLLSIARRHCRVFWW
ncbi:hypothetical protein E2C01_061751 [Portunus trituberculatus]|uniref:Uncharacterized protein n=1 Tax=Portunus trituberculatus TaxID=210409 RepID=A0A5B7HD88_PORTR|nr:hypothetical protein [Portunus trituberculatus]